MKIAHILPALTPGGAERVAIGLAGRAAREGAEVTIFLGWPMPSEGQLRDAIPPEVKVEHLFSRRPGRLGRFPLGARWVWNQRHLLAGYDLIHCHLTFATLVGAAIWLWRNSVGISRPALVETYHSVSSTLSASQRLLHRWLAARSDALVLFADDPAWHSFIKRHPHMLLRTIANGADDPDVAAICDEDRQLYRRQVGIPDSCRFVVGTVGRLERDRQPWLYVTIFAEIARAMGPNVHFVLAGGGSERVRLESLIASHRLEGRVHITGVVAEPRFPLAVMDVYLAMNLGAITGIAGLEAALSGLPLVGVQFDRNYRMQPDEWIWSSTDVSAIAGRVVGLLRHPVARRETARRQELYVRQHRTVEAMWREYKDLYRAVVSRRDGLALPRDGLCEGTWLERMRVHASQKIRD